MIPTRVYIAGAYSQGDVMLNIRTAIMAADVVWRAGGVPFVPHLTGFWHVISPHPYEDWLALDQEWLRSCDVVLRLPGTSGGTDAEVALAIELGMPVYHSLHECTAALTRERIARIAETRRMERLGEFAGPGWGHGE